jgi:hypothetical protein
MDTAETETALASVRAWGQVAAAIAMVAGGRYPRVALTGIADAPAAAAAFGPDAERCGVELVIEERPDGSPVSLLVRRR